MELNIEICPSEKNIAKIIGSDKWAMLSRYAFDNNPHRCHFCNYPEPSEHIQITSQKPRLNVHLLPFDESLDLEKDFKKLQTLLVCDACHALHHFDFSVQKNWIKLVNSSFSQTDLIKICRFSNRMVNAYIIGGHMVEKHIFPLKKTPQKYLDEINESKMNINKKIKVIFTENFDWSKCR